MHFTIAVLTCPICMSLVILVLCSVPKPGCRIPDSEQPMRLEGSHVDSTAPNDAVSTNTGGTMQIQGKRGAQGSQCTVNTARNQEGVT